MIRVQRTVLILTALVALMPISARVARSQSQDSNEAGRETYIISGSAGLPGVKMKGLPGAPVTDDNGIYSVQVSFRWKGTVTPTKEGFQFGPPAKIYSSVEKDYTNQNYRANVLTFTISGSAGLPGVAMEGLPGRVTTDARGYYVAQVEYGWAGTVAPKKEGCKFDPASRRYSRLTEDRGGDDYLARGEMVVISDVIQVDPEGPLEGVTVKAEPGGVSDVTDSQGRYIIRVPYGWTGSLKLTKEGYKLADSLRYTNVTHHLIDGERTSALGEPAIPVPRASAMRPRLILSTRVGDVLVIPTAEVAPKRFAETSEDMQVMLHILRETLSEPRTILGVLYDYGDFFGGSGRDAEALYLEGYGALFVMRVDFPLSFASESRPEDEPEPEADPVWQRARQKLYAPHDARRYGRAGALPAADEMTIEQFQEDMVKALRHAANIRHIDPNESIILTIVGQDESVGPGYGRRGGTYSSSRSGGYVEGGSSYSFGYGSTYSSGGASVYGGGEDGYRDRPARSGNADPKVPALDAYGNQNRDALGRPVYRQATPPAWATVLTIQAKKTDIDAFSKGDTDFETFQQQVKVFTY